jgi:hypothetical protein
MDSRFLIKSNVYFKTYNYLIWKIQSETKLLSTAFKGEVQHSVRCYHLFRTVPHRPQVFFPRSIYILFQFPLALLLYWRKEFPR